MFSELVHDLVTRPAAELDAMLRAAELERRAADARIAAISAVIDGRQTYRDDGHHTMRCYLKVTLNCSGTTANRIRKRAALVGNHAEIGETWLGGHIGTDQIDTLSRGHSHPRAGDQFADFVPVLLSHAEHLEHRNLEHCVDRFIALADTDGAFDDQQFHDDERTASVSTSNGAVDVHAHGGDPIAAAEMKAVFELACQEEFERDCEQRRREYGGDALQHPLPRTARQRRFDALRRIFQSWVTAPAHGKMPEPLVNIVIDDVTAAEALERHGLIDEADIARQRADDAGRTAKNPGTDAVTSLLDRRCHLSDGTPIHPDLALAAMIRSHVRRVVVDSAGVVIDLGRTRRLFTGKARDAARLLATSCSYRGCDIPAEFCDVDHLDEWNSHGHTDQANAAPTCGRHNRHKHRHRLRARRTADGQIRLLRPDGTLVGPVGEREPDWADQTIAPEARAG